MCNLDIHRPWWHHKVKWDRRLNLENKNISLQIKDIYNLQQSELDNAAADLARDQALFVGSKHHHHPAGHNFHSTAQLCQDAAVASTSRIGLCNRFSGLYLIHKKKLGFQGAVLGGTGDKKTIGSESPGPNRMCGQQLATKWNKTSWYVLETTLPPIIMVFCGKNGCVSSIVSFLEKLVGNLHWTIIMGERVSLLGGSSHLQAIKRSWMEREQGLTTPVLGDKQRSPWFLTTTVTFWDDPLSTNTHKNGGTLGPQTLSILGSFFCTGCAARSFAFFLVKVDPKCHGFPQEIAGLMKEL